MACSFVVLSSDGTSYTVSDAVLGSDGTSYTVGINVLASNDTSYAVGTCDTAEATPPAQWGGSQLYPYKRRQRTAEEVEAERIRLGILPKPAKAIKKAVKKAEGKKPEEAKQVLVRELKRVKQPVTPDYVAYFGELLRLSELSRAVLRQQQEQQEIDAIILDMAQYQADLEQQVLSVEAAEEEDVVFMMMMLAA